MSDLTLAPLELAAALARRVSPSSVSDRQIACHVAELSSIARKALRKMVRQCNTGANAKLDVLSSRATAIAVIYGLSASVGGDPRGCCLHLNDGKGFGNTLAGVGFGL